MGGPRSIVRDLRKVALEEGVLLHEIVIDAWKEYLAKPRDLIERGIVITR